MRLSLFISEGRIDSEVHRFWKVSFKARIFKKVLILHSYPRCKPFFLKPICWLYSLLHACLYTIFS